MADFLFSSSFLALHLPAQTRTSVRDFVRCDIV